MNFFKKLFSGVKGKMILSTIPSLIAFGVVSFISNHALNRIENIISEVNSDVTPALIDLGNIIYHRQSISYYTAGAIANPGDAEVRSDYIKKVTKHSEEMKKSITEFLEKFGKSGAVAKDFQKVIETKDEMFKILGEMASNLEAKNPEKDAHVREQLFKGKYREYSTYVRESSESSIKDFKARSNALAAESHQEVSRDKLMITGAIVASVLVLLALMIITAIHIGRNVGGLTKSIYEANSVVSGSIHQLTSAGTTLADSSSGAAASLEETVASLEEMTSMVKMNSDNAKQAASLSQASRDAAEQGEKEIQSLITSMNDISASSKKIEEIINVIDDIAFQTNLLALNAAVEAARAGEQGKGFAVVAEAVRALAQRSAAAAKDISGLIKDSVEKIGHGTGIADRSGTVLNKIVTSVKKVADLNNEISTASSEQTTGISQISKAMNQLDQTSQSNAASSEEIASSAQDIARQTELMTQHMAELTQMILGNQESSHENVVHEKPKAPSKPSPAAKSSHPSASTKGAPKKTEPVAKSAAKKPAPTKPSAPAQSSAKVMKFEKPAAAKAAPPAAAAAPKVPGPKSASTMIPFDEDEPRGKIGGTDGF